MSCENPRGRFDARPDPTEHSYEYFKIRQFSPRSTRSITRLRSVSLDSTTIANAAARNGASSVEWTASP